MELREICTYLIVLVDESRSLPTSTKTVHTKDMPEVMKYCKRVQDIDSQEESGTYRSPCRVWWVRWDNGGIRKHATYERKEIIPSLAKRRSKDNEPLNSPDV